MSSKLNILIIDDEIDICKVISGILVDEGYNTFNAQNSDQALKVLLKETVHLVILDVWLEGSKLDGIELLQKIQIDLPGLPIIVISGHGNIDTAVTAIKIGAYDYIEKPFKTERLIHTIQRALEATTLKQEITNIKNKSNYASKYIGDSATVINLNNNIDKLSLTNSRILITGSIGVGKELVSRLIHNKSKRNNFLFNTINASSLNVDEFQKNFIGQDSVQPKIITETNGGTIFINEISEMDLDTQRLFLSFINNKIGSDNIDIRIISSTSKDLKSYVSLGLFLEELYNRISIEPLHIPSLTDRKEDIPNLVKYFISDYKNSLGLEYDININEESLIILQAYYWPGNIKELKNVIEKLIIIAQAENINEINAEMIPIEIQKNQPNIRNSNETLISYNLKDARDIFERNYLISQLARFNSNISKTAEFIGMERTALHRKLKYLGISIDKR
tara:strand:+ start:6146 stop:7492 length:1347 start_codon:yes stop_codon:yes gene_type:complete